MPYQHRCYLGWTTDLATAPDPHAEWPSSRLDDALVQDFAQTFANLRDLQFTAMALWGLYVTRNWPLDIPSAVPPDRVARTEEILAQAKSHGIRIYAGLGLYSWGYETIIRAHPELAPTNPYALCGSDERSWDWVRRIVDFVLTRFAVDGVSMQSADQGRCHCPKCKPLTDAEYHARLNIRAAEYIHQNHAGKTVAVSSWGMDFSDRTNWPPLQQMSHHLDYLVDVNDTAGRNGRDSRREFIQSLHCAFGTLGGPQVEPPQHWQRDRWFLPSPRRVHQHLHELAEDGGQACEWFFHILHNPGDALTHAVAGQTLANPGIAFVPALENAINTVFAPRTSAVGDELSQLTIRAEDAYYTYLMNYCGTVSLEPLVEDEPHRGLNYPGPPVYLQGRLNREQRSTFRAEIVALRPRFVALRDSVAHPERIDLVTTGLDNMVGDVDSLAGSS